MVRGSYHQQVMTFFFSIFDLRLSARLKLQFQIGTLLLKVWIHHCSLSEITAVVPQVALNSTDDHNNDTARLKLK